MVERCPTLLRCFHNHNSPHHYHYPHPRHYRRHDIHHHRHPYRNRLCPAVQSYIRLYHTSQTSAAMGFPHDHLSKKSFHCTWTAVGMNEGRPIRIPPCVGVLEVA